MTDGVCISISTDAYADLQKHYPTDSWNDQGNNAYGCVKQLYLLKKNNRGLKVLLSIGGWTYSQSGHFAPLVGSDTARQNLANSAVTFVKDWGLDGIDIDWEYPSTPQEAQAFVLLVQACRQALDQHAAQHAPGYHFLITVASPAGPSHYGAMDLKGMAPYVDVWHLMAYDYAGGWDATTGHQANLYASTADPAATKFSTDRAVGDYVAAGVAARRISLGLPLYGRSFEGAGAAVGQPYTGGVGPGSSGTQGVWLYRTLPKAGATVHYDDGVKASWSYDAAAQELISYDSPDSARQKAAYVRRKGLGGAAFWEAGGDRDGEGSLVGTMKASMGVLEQSQNWLLYPQSQYDNIRAGMPES